MVVTCENCKRSFLNSRGLKIHSAHCKRQLQKISVSANESTSINTQHSDDVVSIMLDADEIDLIREGSNEPNLPCFTPVPKHPNRPFANIPGNEFAETIDNIYNEIIHWRKNLFKLPSGKASKLFITELTTWLEHFNKNSDFQMIAMKVFMTLPSLILQKPSKNSKSKEHLKKVELRMTAWKDGKIDEILNECRDIQKKLLSSKRPPVKDLSRTFAKLMFQGKISAALKMLTDDNQAGVHDVTKEVLGELQDKHPNPAPIQDNSLLNGPINRISPHFFDEIDELVILKAARVTKGSGGPSKLDAEQFSHILTSTKFKRENKELREQIAIFAKKVATEVLDPKIFEPYVSCRLIPLDKDPGSRPIAIRPIGIGEVIRRVVGKAVGWSLKMEIQTAAGPLQTATGIQGGAEAAIHAMKTIYERDDIEGVILVDASNAFNSLNRKVALHNVQVLCPNFATILINTYRQPSRLVILGGNELLSAEGTTQGDNLAMSFYAIGTDPLLTFLKVICPNIYQVALADDITGAGTLKDLKDWWDTIISEGKKLGYFVNEGKSWLILKKSSQLDDAINLFKDTSIKITTDGKRHLGAVIGTDAYRNNYMQEKVNDWHKEIEKLTEFAKTEPQAAYSAFLHGEVHKFTYFMRTIPEIGGCLKKIDELITNKFLPASLSSQQKLENYFYSRFASAVWAYQFL